MQSRVGHRDSFKHSVFPNHLSSNVPFRVYCNHCLTQIISRTDIAASYKMTLIQPLYGPIVLQRCIDSPKIKIPWCPILFSTPFVFFLCFCPCTVGGCPLSEIIHDQERNNFDGCNQFFRLGNRSGTLQIQILTHRGQGQAMTSDIRRDNRELKTGLKNALAAPR